jgi:hypothetical protein
MARFTEALSLLLIAAAGSAQAAIPATLLAQAKLSAKTNPKLRAKEAENTKKFNQKFSKMAFPKRFLQNNNYNNYNNGQYDYQQEQDQWNDVYNWDQEMAEENFGFEVTQFSIKFNQCATVESYSSNLAEDEDSDTVLAAQRFAIFRLCPADQCSSSNSDGCSNSYGEYVVSLDQYMAALIDSEEERVANYCAYCQECATIESAKYFWQEVEAHRQSALETAEQNYETWYENNIAAYEEQQNAYQNNAYQQNANGNAYQNAYQQVDAADVAQRYYSYIRNKNNYANQYYQNNYGGQNSGYQNNAYNVNGQSSAWDAQDQPQWDSVDMWEVMANSKRQYQNQNAWANMGNSFGTYFGQTVLNGYFDQNGDFNEGWGYFNCYGNFISLEEESGEWDECIWGEEPDGWDGVDVDSESCNYEYAGSCYNQYDACMSILQDADYEEYQQYKNGGYYNNQNQAQQKETYTMADFIECTQVDHPDQRYNGNMYANQDYYAQQYTAKQEWLNSQYSCYDGDEDCENQREYALQQWQYENSKKANRKYYIGPHCGSNGRSISLAVYKDQYCSVIDEDTSISTLLGSVPTDNVNLVPNDCIRCGREEWEDAAAFQWYEDEEVDDNNIEPMCSMLYQLAGKCNKHLSANDLYNYNYNINAGNDEWEQMYQSEQQAANEEAVCTFIDSLRSNTYDENGQVILQAGAAWKNPSQWSSEFQAESRALNGGMKAALSLLAIAVSIMGVWACFLHGTLARKNIPWAPTRRQKGDDPTDIARANSGIVMGRSRSGPGNAPLI